MSFSNPRDFRSRSKPAIGLINLRSILLVIALEVLMLVPFVRMAHLNEPHAFLREAPRHQTLTAEILRDRIVETVEFLRCFRFVAQILQTRSFSLHAERKLERFDSSFECAVRTGEFELLAV